MCVLICELQNLLALYVKNHSAIAANCELGNTSVPDFGVLLVLSVHTIPEAEKYFPGSKYNIMGKNLQHCLPTSYKIISLPVLVLVHHGGLLSKLVEDKSHRARVALCGSLVKALWRIPAQTPPTRMRLILPPSRFVRGCTRPCPLWHPPCCLCGILFLTVFFTFCSFK